MPETNVPSAKSGAAPDLPGAEGPVEASGVVWRTVPLPPCSLSIEDVRQIVRVLEVRNTEAMNIELSQLHRLPDEIDEDFRNFVEFVGRSYEVSVVITGEKGDQIIGRGDRIFSVANIPEPIKSVYINNKATYAARRNNREPLNWFSIMLDFSRPPLLDWRNPLSAPTPNESVRTLRGSSDAWVSAVLQGVIERVSTRRNGRAFIHMPFSYEILLWFLGLPLIFYGVFELSPVIEKLVIDGSNILRIALYFHIFLISTIIFRTLYGYTKWAFPKVELVSSGSTTTAHRRFWYAVVASLVAAVIASIAGI